jgi:hypothetical protein
VAFARNGLTVHWDRDYASLLEPENANPPRRWQRADLLLRATL